MKFLGKFAVWQEIFARSNFRKFRGFYNAVLYRSAVREIQDRNLPDIRESLFPAIKSEIQIRQIFVPAKRKNPAIHKIITSAKTS